MKILIAPDSFKENLSALEIAQAIKKGLQVAMPDAECTVFPMADGGDGTLDVVAYHLDHKEETFVVTSPSGRVVDAKILWLEEGKTAWIEVAQASGIELLSPSERDPWTVSSHGVGELILHTLNRGAEHLILSLGGTGTNDGGMGMLQALGAKFYREDDSFIKGIDLKAVASADLSEAMELMEHVKLTVLTDVMSPLLGKMGASYVFAAQKGAKQEDLPNLDAAMRNFAEVTEEIVGNSYASKPGAGAAGGLGFAFYLLGTQDFDSGANYLIELFQMEEKVRDCDLVITGEGRFDNQSLVGKIPAAIAKKAQKNGKPLFLLAGQISHPVTEAYDRGFTGIFSIQQGVYSMEHAFQNAERYLEITAENIARLLILPKF